MFSKLLIYVVYYYIFRELTKVHVYELKIISDQVFNLFFFFCFFCFVLFLMKMLMAVSLTPSSIHSCVSAFLPVWGLGARFLRSASPCACYMILHDVDFKAYLSAALWCCGFVRALAVILRSCSCAYIPFFSRFSSMQFISPCFVCLIVLSGTGSSSPLYRDSVFLQSCNCNLRSCKSLVLCCPVSARLWLKSWGPIILYQS